MVKKANYKELAFMLVVGMLQPITEIAIGPQAATYYNLFAILIVLGYVFYRFKRFSIPLRQWGVRMDTLKSSLPAYALFSLGAGLALYRYGLLQGHADIPVTFWYLIALYPLWGFGQQFVLQNLVADNLTTITPNLVPRALLVAGIFSLSHVPSPELVMLTFIAGFFFTLLYHYKPNLILLGISHGILGALAFYLVLGKDQWSIVLKYFS